MLPKMIEKRSAVKPPIAVLKTGSRFTVIPIGAPKVSRFVKKSLHIFSISFDLNYYL